MLAFTEMILETLRESPMLKYLKLRISGGYVLESLLGGPHLPSAGGAPPSRVISVSPLGSPTLRLPLCPPGARTPGWHPQAPLVQVRPHRASGGAQPSRQLIGAPSRDLSRRDPSLDVAGSEKLEGVLIHCSSFVL